MLSDRDYMNDRQSRWPGQHTSIVTLLIWANVIVFVLQFLSTDRLTDVLCLSAPGVRHLELWRLGTYMFVHGGFLHILFNMWPLYLFGRLLEERIGGTRFLHLYLVSGLLGGLVWLFFNWNSPEPVVGASGAVFGVLMAAAMTFPNQKIMLLLPPVEMRLKTFVAVFAAIEIFSEFGQATGTWNDRIAHLAHLGGMLGGFLYMRRIMPDFRIRVRDWWRNLIRRRPGPPSADADDRTGDALPPAEFQREVDRILDKIGREGLAGLTIEERKTMERARKRLRER